MEDGPPIFRQDNTCPVLLVFTLNNRSCTGLSPCIAPLSRGFHSLIKRLRATPGSLAATAGISIDFFSFGYLDVSVPRVRLHTPMYSVWDTGLCQWVSPFGHPRLKRVLLPHLGLSQVTTSFIASDCQGIHRVRLVT